MFGWLKRKKEIELLKEETKKGFDSVKNDISSVGEWIKHLDSEQKGQENDLEEIKDILSSVNEELEGLKNVLSIMNDLKPKQLFKTPQQLFRKKTPVYLDQRGVQTSVQTPNLDDFSITERAILWILLNSDMKLSYDDIASLLGKSRSTIRGQMNKMQAKSEGLIEEIIERNGKKRMFIPDKIKAKLLKKVKVKMGKKPKKVQKMSGYR